MMMNYFIAVDVIFWAVTSAGLVGMCQRFGGTYCLYLKAEVLKMEAVCNAETLVPVRADKLTSRYNSEGQRRNFHSRK
jgi:hypothetical protein